MLIERIFRSRFTLAAILLVATVQLHTLRTQDDFLGKPRWKAEGFIHWDVQEYYMYLPATFIYNDPAFRFIDTLKGHEREHFWIGKSPNGKYTGRFSIGMSIAYFPFFYMADEVADAFGYKRDGYSDPYQFALYMSGFIYSLLGFLFLGMCLRRYFKDMISAFTIICIGLGTNLFYYSTTEGAMTHAVLFCLYAVFLYCTFRWHRTPKVIFILSIALVFGLAVLIRPTTVLISFIFLLYGVYDQESLKSKVNMWQLAVGLGLLILMSLPQLLYWKQQTGSYIYYSYTGERFFFQHPRIWRGLFSFRKGWLLYTPMMGLALCGFFFIKKYARGLSVPLAVFVVLNVYVVLSWWCWWYGGGFGLRAFIESYVFLAFPLGAFWQWALEKGWTASVGLALLACFFIRLNLFQSKQYREGMLHWDSMSKEMYRSTFMYSGYIKDADKLIDPPDYDAAKKGEDEKRKQNHVP
jgi:hypothetical protein